MARKSALIYVLDNDGKLVDAFIKCETAADPAPTTVELEIARIVKEHRELKAENELLKNNDPISSQTDSIPEIKLFIEDCEKGLLNPDNPHKADLYGYKGEGALQVSIKWIVHLLYWIENERTFRKSYFKALKENIKRTEEIDRLTTELTTLKDECTCEECSENLEDPETGVTAFCISCWNAMVGKLRVKIDRLTAENAQIKAKLKAQDEAHKNEIFKLNDICISMCKIKDTEIARLKPFERFYRHIEEHLGPEQRVICKICGKSLREIEQALDDKTQDSERNPRGKL